MNILFINACARPDSRTDFLAQHILNKLKGQVNTLDLYSENLPPLDYKQLKTRDEYIASGDFSSPVFRYAKKFASADTIVIAAPYWDLAFPSVLRIYLEHVTVSGVTFKYSPEGIPIGLCKAKRLIYVTTSGGPIVKNLGYDYIKALSDDFYGIQDVKCYKAENLDIAGADVENILQEAIQNIESTEFN